MPNHLEAKMVLFHQAVSNPYVYLHARTSDEYFVLIQVPHYRMESFQSFTVDRAINHDPNALLDRSVRHYHLFQNSLTHAALQLQPCSAYVSCRNATPLPNAWSLTSLLTTASGTAHS